VTPLLRFEEVALRRGGRLLFEALSFELKPGERLQVAGPNGSG
jgi:ABC-type molybdenum transport system ATPase subunit/photorepair protein PhrA